MHRPCLAKSAHQTSSHGFRLRTPPWPNIARRKFRSLHEISGLMGALALPSPLLAGRVRGFPGASLPRRPLANDVGPAESRAPWRRFFRWRRTPGPGRETASRPDRGGQALWQQCHKHEKIEPDRGVKCCIAATGGILWPVCLRLDGWGRTGLCAGEAGRG